MEFGLKQETIDKINSVFRKHPEIDKVIIYGSRAKGNFRKGSDIDLTLIGNDLEYDLVGTIDSEIDDLNTPYLFDISIFKLLNSPSLEEHINRVGKVFYKK
ncbi:MULTISPECIES: nucleotidyltransferase domain-containing protein [unclassified Flavobacterium]|jgi:predicted nucleotidyltransferase|uniref:nucleotidyltransferase domain-containing protein n=1 Tax=unclassified Flavobacterium TaxID=196869 RepID=UPI0025B97DF0|nr:MULTISPECIES: nucleotidyltransferase domain-containing protein [unclassified Flavobacterium]